MKNKYFKQNKKNKIQFCGILLFVFCLNNAIAGTFHIQINADGGIPAVDTIVQQSNQNPAPDDFLMATFNRYPPESVRYLLTIRPTGNLLDLINQSPNLPLAQLYRTLIVEYPFAMDVTPVFPSLQNDSLVEVASFISGALNPVVFEPTPVSPNTSSSVHIAMNNECEESGLPGMNIQGLTHNINVLGNIIELEAIMLIMLPGQPTVCLNGSSELTRYNLGLLQPGNYTLKIFKHYGNSAFPIDESQRIYVGERDFQVVSPNGTIQSIPIFDFPGLWILIILTLLLSKKSLQRKP